MSDRILYGVNELPKVTGLGNTKLREEIAAKRLIARKVGKRLMVSATDLRAWAENLPMADLTRAA